MARINNVADVASQHMCIGCGVCKVICSFDAIRIVLKDQSGLFVPAVDSERCTKCGLCLSVCFGYYASYELTSAESAMKLGRVHEVLFSTPDRAADVSKADLGTLTSLLLVALESGQVDGAIVAAMKRGRVPRAISYIADSNEKLKASRGSKYCPVSFHLSLESLDPNRRYAVVGLPCQLYAIRNLARQETRYQNIVLFIGLFCGGMPTYLGTEYILQELGFKDCNIDFLSYRSGDWPGSLVVRGQCKEHRKEVRIAYPDYWLDSGQYFLHKRCIICHDGFNYSADLSCGDLWLPPKERGDFISIILSRNEKSSQLIAAACKRKLLNTKKAIPGTTYRAQAGLISMKNHHLLARVKLERFLRRVIPSFNMSHLPNPTLQSCLWAIDSLFSRAIGSRRYCWFLIRPYRVLKSLISKFLHGKHPDKESFQVDAGL